MATSTILWMHIVQQYHLLTRTWMESVWKAILQWYVFLEVPFILDLHTQGMTYSGI